MELLSCYCNNRVLSSIVLASLIMPEPEAMTLKQKLNFPVFAPRYGTLLRHL